MTDTPIQDQLRQALRAAMKTQDTAAASALRSALAAIANAEAVPTAVTPPPGGHRHIAGSVQGLGAAEAERRTLSEADVAGIVQAEVADRKAAAAQYEQADHPGRAERLLREADVLLQATAGHSRQ
jgi:uncharacterized protein YqeY